MIRALGIAAFNFFLIFLLSCTPKAYTEKPKITLTDYKKQSVILVGAVSKLINEESIEKMHQVSSSLRQSRVLTCVGVLNECEVHQELLSKIIQFSKDKKMTMEEHKELRLRLKKLSELLNKAALELSRNWSKYNKENL